MVFCNESEFPEMKLVDKVTILILVDGFLQSVELGFKIAKKWLSQSLF